MDCYLFVVWTLHAQPFLVALPWCQSICNYGQIMDKFNVLNK